MSRAALLDDLWQNDVRELRRLRAENRALRTALEAVGAERDFVVRCNDHIQRVVYDALAPPRVAKCRGRKT